MSDLFGAGSEDLDWTSDLGEYEGERNELGERHGYGKAVLPNGDIYEGNYVNGKRHGKGTYIFRNGAKYKGFYDEGKKSGHGTFEYPDGSKYEGKWEDNERNGQGMYLYINGDVYEGEWKDNKRQGKGVYTCAATKLKYDGSWMNGRLSGPVKMILPNHVYLGTFYDSLPCGPGRYVFDFGIEQHGEYIITEKLTENEEQIMDVPVWKCKPDLYPLGSTK
ncbi:unnamed protein product [Porites lobata]|uniref:MORN repeat-containing protein 1 n=1 Tax=Porites lobata TaxID=104759 RepID=A0ABN8NER3_9CNID|nr:unnamed protein product [Porites lobata]